MDQDKKFMDDQLYEAARVKGSDIPSCTDAESLLHRTPVDRSNVLHVAAHCGNEVFFKGALARFPTHRFHLLCGQNASGETPLHLAAQSGDQVIVKSLLDAHDEDPYGICLTHNDRKEPCWGKGDKRGDTPIHRALRFRHEEIALQLLERDKKLVSCCNDLGESLAYVAAENFCCKFLQKILDVDGYDQTNVSFSGSYGQTLFHPTRKLTEGIMSILIERGASLLNDQDDERKTVLHYAVEEGREPLVKMLLKANSSLAHLADKDGFTPLHRAATMGLSSMVRTILDLSPQSILFRTPRGEGHTALHVAKMDACSLAGCLRHTRMKELIDVVDDQGNTALHLALIKSDFDKANVLLGIDDINWRLKNNDGRTPMDLCKSNVDTPAELCKSKDRILKKLKQLESAWRVKEMINMELFHHQNVKNVEDLLRVHRSLDQCLSYVGHQGNTILHIAARDGYIDFINEGTQESNRCRLLLLSGENSKGETPLHVAAEYGQLEVMKFILKTSLSVDGSGNEKSILVENGLEYEQAEIKPWRMKSANGDTPLHKAVRNGHAQIALDLLRCDPELASFENGASESVLYLAARSLCYEVVREILVPEKYEYSTSGSDGQNPLHAAARSTGCLFHPYINIPPPEDVANATFPSMICNFLIRRLPDGLVNEVDNKGRTPLHYAVERNQALIVRELLSHDKSAAFVYDNEGFTPLLRAAANGFHRCVTSILDCCPHSAELRDIGNHSTALHLAKMTAPSCMDKLVNETDMDDNTPLHHAILNSEVDLAIELILRSKPNLRIRNKLQQTPQDLCQEMIRKGDDYQVKLDEFFGLPGGRTFFHAIQALRTHLLPSGYPLPLEFFFQVLTTALFGSDTYLENMTEQDLKQLLNNIFLCATLLVTVSFAAAFTIPGGYDQNTGQVLRMKQAAIKAFLASDVIAMLLGVGVLLRYTFGATTRMKSLKKMAIDSALMLNYSLTATVIAFISGTYALASHDAHQIYILAVVFSFLIFYGVRMRN